MKVIKQLLLIFTVGSVLVSGCFLLRETQYVSFATIWIVSADSSSDTSELEREKIWQADCAAKASEGTHAVFEKVDKSKELWELRVIGRDPQLAKKSYEKILNRYLSASDSVERKVLEAPTIGSQ